jgi:hypothetical protein
LSPAAHQVVLQSSDFMYKVKATIQQFQNNRLLTELLRGEIVDKIFAFRQASAIARKLKPLIKNPFNLYQIEVSYFF